MKSLLTPEMSLLSVLKLITIRLRYVTCIYTFEVFGIEAPVWIHISYP